MRKRIIDNKILIDYIDKSPVKIVENVEFKSGGKYENLKYHTAIENNSSLENIFNRSYNKNQKNKDAYEELVRMYYLTKLCNELGYLPENIEIEREFISGSEKSGNDYLDIIVYYPNSRTDVFMAIELKSPEAYEKSKEHSIQNQLYKLGSMGLQEKQPLKIDYLVYATVESNGSDFYEYAEVIDFKKIETYQKYINAKNQNMSFEKTLPKNYEKIDNLFFGNVENKTDKLQPLPYIINEINSKKLTETLHDILWGGGSSTDNEIFNFLTKLLLTKIYDEEITDFNKKYSFQVFSQINKDGYIIPESDEELYKRLNMVYENAVRERMFILKTADTIAKDEFKPKLKQVVSVLQSYSFLNSKMQNNGVDILGQFFEIIVNKDFKQSKGQFFTPTSIVRFMLNGLKIDEIVKEKFKNDGALPYMIDPSCGSGTFLIEYMKYVSEVLNKTYYADKNLSSARRNQLNSFIGANGNENLWAKHYIYGTEISQDLGTAVKVNMILHGDGASNIFCGNIKGDGLSPFNVYKKPSGESSLLNSGMYNEDKYYKHQINGKFDFILSNPPFSVVLTDATKQQVERNFDIPYKEKNSEDIFIERYYQLLKENGRMAIVLPESCFDGGISLQMRQFLFKYFDVKAIVSLPILAFEPFTATKTSILFARKKTQKELSVWDELEKKYLNDENAFNKIAQTLCNAISIINIDDVGYKKSKKSYLKRPNELYSLSDEKNIVFTDIYNHSYAIYDMRNIDWGNKN